MSTGVDYAQQLNAAAQSATSTGTVVFGAAGDLAPARGLNRPGFAGG